MTAIGVESVPPLAQRTGAHRSRVTNGSKLLPLADGRSVTARRFKDLVEFISVDLGGVDRLSEGEKQLVRRAAALSAECERQEALWARGEAEFDIASYSLLTNAVRRVFETIGLKRVPRNVTPGSLEVVASSPSPDLTQLSASELDKLYRLLAEAREGGSAGDEATVIRAPCPSTLCTPPLADTLSAASLRQPQKSLTNCPTASDSVRPYAQNCLALGGPSVP
jgi:hypothetical protein